MNETEGLRNFHAVLDHLTDWPHHVPATALAYVDEKRVEQAIATLKLIQDAKRKLTTHEGA